MTNAEQNFSVWITMNDVKQMTKRTLIIVEFILFQGPAK